MRSGTITVSLLALAGSAVCQHVHFAIPEVEHFVDSMLNQFEP